MVPSIVLIGTIDIIFAIYVTRVACGNKVSISVMKVAFDSFRGVLREMIQELRTGFREFETSFLIFPPSFNKFKMFTLSRKFHKLRQL